MLVYKTEPLDHNSRVVVVVCKTNQYPEHPFEVAMLNTDLGVTYWPDYEATVEEATAKANSRRLVGR